MMCLRLKKRFFNIFYRCFSESKMQYLLDGLTQSIAGAKDKQFDVIIGNSNSGKVAQGLDRLGEHSAHRPKRGRAQLVQVVRKQHHLKSSIPTENLKNSQFRLN